MSNVDRGETVPYGIDPAQAPFWDDLQGTRTLDAAEVQPHSVEYLTEPVRLREVRRQYPCPTVADVGHGPFCAAVALVFVDDESKRAVAYAPPVTVLRTALEDRAETIRVLRDGLAMIDALASDQWDNAAATVQRMHEAAIETLRRAGVRLDATPTGNSH